jgi:hypothetical protein
MGIPKKGTALPMLMRFAFLFDVLPARLTQIVDQVVRIKKRLELQIQRVAVEGRFSPKKVDAHDG